MRRGLYITTAVLGAMLVIAAALAALLVDVPPGDRTTAATAEGIAAVVGLGLTWAGLVQARAAGDQIVVRHRRSRSAPAGPAGPQLEMAFDCPACGRIYRAPGSLAGRPFACRACDTRFTVPRL